MEVINWRLMSHPMNWAILFLMIFVFLFGVHLVIAYGQANGQTT